MYERGLTVAREIGDQSLTAVLLNNIANVLRQQGSLAAALKTYEESLAISREIGDRSSVALTLNNMAIGLRVQGDLAGAKKRYLEALEIRRAIGDGSGSHVNITYVEEGEPLGTAGALGLIPGRLDEPFFVLNCDVLTDIDLRHMHRFHLMNRSQLTVAVKDHEVEVPFGVVEVDHERVIRLSEKPKMKFYVNAGIYLLDPSVKDRIVAGRRCDLTDVINGLLESGGKVCSFPIRTFWYDVGDRETLARVQALEL